MNRLSLEQRSLILSCLVEGNSIRATCRLTGAAKDTVSKLFREAASACAEYQDKTLRNLPCKRIQVDEIWSFCYAKQKNVPEEYQGVDGYGTVWTWVALCADTKLVPSWFVGDRETHSAYQFLSDLKERIPSRIQLTSDGYKAYPVAVEETFGDDIDFSTLVKLYEGENEEGKPKKRTRYKGAKQRVIKGKPHTQNVSTSFVERQNLTLRMQNRRFTRKTNAFSKKIENHKLSVALHFMYYNFVRVHQTLRVTPAMEAGVAGKIWEVEDMVKLI